MRRTFAAALLVGSLVAECTTIRSAEPPGGQVVARRPFFHEEYALDGYPLECTNRYRLWLGSEISHSNGDSSTPVAATSWGESSKVDTPHALKSHLGSLSRWTCQVRG
jgi:hypothetical protein